MATKILVELAASISHHKRYMEATVLSEKLIIPDLVMQTAPQKITT
jgi:hypothetical protein